MHLSQNYPGIVLTFIVVDFAPVMNNHYNELYEIINLVKKIKFNSDLSQFKIEKNL